MQVDISARAQAQIEEILSHGSFSSAAEVIETALQELAAREATHWERVRDMIDEGIRDIDEGRYVVLTPDTAPAILADIIARGRERLNARSGE
jgi:Arc/MetJ-type ribon-helix-helix transcriptional regulator